MSLGSVLKTLLEIENSLDRIYRKEKQIMAKLKDFQDLLKAVDEETNRIGAKIEELLAKLEAGGLSEAEEAEVFEGFRAAAERLKVVGADPADPVPPVE